MEILELLDLKVQRELQDSKEIKVRLGFKEEQGFKEIKEHKAQQLAQLVRKAIKVQLDSKAIKEL
jgi:virulence-associated protein VapD